MKGWIALGALCTVVLAVLVATFAPATSLASATITVDTATQGLGVQGCSFEEAILAAKPDTPRRRRSS